MNSTLVRSSVFAVAMLAFGTLTYAQNYEKVVADISFNFRSPSVDLPAGEYAITPMTSSGVHVFKLTNEKSRQSVLLLSQYEIAGKRDEEPRLVFRCNSAACGLSEVWMGAAGYKIPTPRISRSEGERIAIIPLKVVHSSGD